MERTMQSCAQPLVMNFSACLLLTSLSGPQLRGHQDEKFKLDLCQKDLFWSPSLPASSMAPDYFGRESLLKWRKETEILSAK